MQKEKENKRYFVYTRLYLSEEGTGIYISAPIRFSTALENRHFLLIYLLVSFHKGKNKRKCVADGLLSKCWTADGMVLRQYGYPEIEVLDWSVLRGRCNSQEDRPPIQPLLLTNLAGLIDTLRTLQLPSLEWSRKQEQYGDLRFAVVNTF